jgi:AcrR family transcriptional regulator
MVTAILDATARILARDGYDAITTNKVAELAGVSVGSLYQYFPDKAALVGAVAVRHTEAMAEVLSKATSQTQGDDLPTLVERLVRATLQAHELDPRLRLAIIEELPRIGRPRRISELKRAILRSVEEMLASRNSDLGLKDVPLAAFMVVSAVEHISHAAQSARRYDSASLGRELQRLVLNYLTALDR